MALSAVRDQPSCADLHARALHALGATYLGMGQWQRAHLTWLEWQQGDGDGEGGGGGESGSLLCEQIQKLRAYPSISTSCNATATASEGGPFATLTLLPGKVFLSSREVVSPSQCSQLIGEAEALARSGEG